MVRLSWAAHSKQDVHHGQAGAKVVEAFGVLVSLLRAAGEIVNDALADALAVFGVRAAGRDGAHDWMQIVAVGAAVVEQQPAFLEIGHCLGEVVSCRGAIHTLQLVGKFGFGGEVRV